MEEKIKTFVSSDRLGQPVAPHLQEINQTLSKLFDQVLIPKESVFPDVDKNSDFPFPDYDSAVSAIKTGEVCLSFGTPSGTYFSAIATKYEKHTHIFLMLVYAVFAPLSLIIGVYLTQNYYLLLLGLLWLPLAFFGTHPAYRSAPKFIFLSIFTVMYGAYFGSGAWMVVGMFLFFCISGYSATRYYYNKIIIKRALEMEKAFMFLLGSNALFLCRRDGVRLW